ncbi:hypothetical protein ACSBR1_005932 [Camellia fascicularis]
MLLLLTYCSFLCMLYIVPLTKPIFIIIRPFFFWSFKKIRELSSNQVYKDTLGQAQLGSDTMTDTTN